MSELVEIAVEGRADEALLLAYAQQREEKAFEAIVRRHARWVYAAAFRQVRDRQLAEDATQAVFVMLAQRAESVAERKVSGWLFMTVCYTVRAMRKSERRRRVRERRVAREVSAGAEKSGALWEELDDAMARLTEGDRVVLLLRFYREMEFAEVARELGITEASARKRVTRAVERLRGKLGAGAMSASVVMLAAQEGMPGGEVVSGVLETARAAASGGKVSAGVMSAMKGAMMVMAMIKAKVVLLVLAVVVVVGAISWEVARGGEVAATREAGVAATQRVMTFAERYGLAEGEVVKVVKPPFGEERLEIIREQRPGSPLDSGESLRAVRVVWHGGAPLVEEAAWGGKPGGFLVRDILWRVLKISPPQIEGDRSLLNKRVDGDLVVRSEATMDDYQAAIAKLIGEELGEHVQLQLVTAEREIIVVKGALNENGPGVAKPGGGRPEQITINGTHANQGARVDIYGGSFDQLAADLSTFLDRQVVLEVTVPERVRKEGWLVWSIKVTPDSTMANAELALKQLEEQTGWKWGVEKRKVTRLVVEKVE